MDSHLRRLQRMAQAGNPEARERLARAEQRLRVNFKPVNLLPCIKFYQGNGYKKGIMLLECFSFRGYPAPDDMDKKPVTVTWMRKDKGIIIFYGYSSIHQHTATCNCYRCSSGNYWTD